MGALTVVGSLPSSEIARLTAMLHHPGEKVSVRPSLAGRDRADPRLVALIDKGPLTIGRTVVEDAGNGQIKASYAFEAVEGEFPAASFVQPEPTQHVTGTILTREGVSYVAMETWTDDGERIDGVASDVRVLAQEVTRWIAYSVAPDPALFFAELEGTPGNGEFVLADLGDGTWRLEGVPWWTDASVEEVARADAMVRERLAGVVPSA